MKALQTLPGAALLNGGRILLSASVTVVLYRFLLDRIGAEGVGLWAVILATAGAGGLGAGGLGSGLLRFVGPAAIRGNPSALAELVHTAVLAALTVLAAALPLLAWLGPELVALFVPEPLHPVMRMSFPFALAALGCASIAGLYQAVFEGLQRYDLTNGILFTGTLGYAAGAFLLVPRYGVPGLAAAQLLQWVLVLAAFLAASVRSPFRIPLLPRMWSTGALRQLIGFGSRVQGMALLAYIADPVTKWVVTSVAGIAATAYLDMGARLVGIIRQVVVGAAAPLVPVVASLTTETPVLMADRYRRALRLMLVLAPALLLSPAALAPSISLVWIGRYEPLLVQALIVLSIAWCANAVSAPAYFFLLGSGRVRYLLAGHLVTALGTASLGVLGGWLWGYTGVLIACGTAVVAGSSFALLGIGPSLFPGSHPPVLAAIRDTALIYGAAVAASLHVTRALPGGSVSTVLAAAIFAAGGALAVTRAGGWGDISIAFAAFARPRGRERP